MPKSIWTTTEKIQFLNLATKLGQHYIPEAVFYWYGTAFQKNGGFRDIDVFIVTELLPNVCWQWAHALAILSEYTIDICILTSCNFEIYKQCQYSRNRHQSFSPSRNWKEQSTASESIETCKLLKGLENATKS